MKQRYNSSAYAISQLDCCLSDCFDPQTREVVHPSLAQSLQDDFEAASCEVDANAAFSFKFFSIKLSYAFHTGG